MQYFGFDRPSFAFKTYGFGANFDPLDLFAGGKQGVWYDPSDKSTLFQDVAGTIPVVNDGDPVALMLDKSGSGNHAEQTTSTSRPIHKINTTKGIYFDGVDDFAVSKKNAIGTGQFAIAVALDIDPSSYTIKQMDIVEASDAGGLNGGRVLILNGHFGFQVGNGARVTITTPILSNKAVLMLIYNGTHMIARVNGSEIGRQLVSGYVSPSAGTVLGREKIGNGHYLGGISGLIIMQGAVTDDDVLKTESYLAAKAGVTL